VLVAALTTGGPALAIATFDPGCDRACDAMEGADPSARCIGWAGPPFAPPNPRDVELTGSHVCPEIPTAIEDAFGFVPRWVHGRRYEERRSLAATALAHRRHPEALLGSQPAGCARALARSATRVAPSRERRVGGASRLRRAAAERSRSDGAVVAGGVPSAYALTCSSGERQTIVSAPRDDLQRRRRLHHDRGHRTQQGRSGCPAGPRWPR